MKIRQETTVWKDAPGTPNHIYLTEGSTLVGYIKSGEKKAFYFQEPMKQWATTRRKFRTLGKREIAELEL